MSPSRENNHNFDATDLYNISFDNFGPSFDDMGSYDPFDMSIYNSHNHPVNSFDHAASDHLIEHAHPVALSNPSRSAHSASDMTRGLFGEAVHNNNNSSLQSHDNFGMKLRPNHEGAHTSDGAPYNLAQSSQPRADMSLHKYDEAVVHEAGEDADYARESTGNTDGNQESSVSLASGPRDDAQNTSAVGDEDVQVPLTIRSEQEFLDELGKRVKDDRGRKQRNLLEDGKEIDFPETEAEKLEHIQKLVSAIKNTKDIVDKPCKNGRPAQAAQRFDRGYYPQQQIELAAWTILFGLRDAQLGVVLVELHHGYKYEQYASFEARFKAVVSTLRRSKATCKQLLDPHYIDRLCDAPDAELLMKLSNKKVNAQRDTQNQIGRKVLAGELAPDTIASLKIEEAPTTPHTRRALRNREAPEGKIAILTPKRPSKNNSSSKVNTKGNTGRRAGNRVKKELLSDDEDDEDFEDEEEDDVDNYYVTPRSSSKRKVGRVKYTEDAESSDDDDSEYRPNQETPTKKARTSTRRRGAIGPSSVSRSHQSSRIAPESDAYPAEQAMVADNGLAHVGHHRNLPSPAGSFVHHGLPLPPMQVNSSGYSGHNTSAHNTYLPPMGYHQYNAPGLSWSSVQSPATNPNAGHNNMDVNKNDRYDAYRDVVCDLLNIHREEGKGFSLDELRRYARAYNKPYEHSSYTDSQTPGWTFIACQAIRHGTTLGHFAMFFPQMKKIGKIRGDIDASGQAVPFPPHASGFQARNDNEKQAVGAINNEFGLRTDLYPANESQAGAHTTWNSVEYGGSGSLFSDTLPSRK